MNLIEPRSAWTSDPLVLLCLLLSGALYLFGANRVRGMRRWNIACFWTGWGSLWIALGSSLHTLGETLFSAHVAQQQMIAILSAPMLVLGRPMQASSLVLPEPWRNSIRRWSERRAVTILRDLVTRPLTAWILYCAILWSCHLPVLFQPALPALFVSALLFWSALVRLYDAGDFRRAGLYLFTTLIQTAILGALLSSNRLWHPQYARPMQVLGLAPLEDQQLGGLILWMTGSLSYLTAGVVLFALWIRASDASATRSHAA
jgi:Predicted membrane protein